MPLRILVVDDDLLFGNALRDVLNLEGFAADSVGTISSYRAWHQSHDCDVLIVDRGLPDGDGIDVIKMHRLSESGPVIIISCNGLVEDRIEGIDADADYYLVKPIRTDELVSLLKRLARRTQSNTEKNSDWILHAASWRLCNPEGQAVPLNQNELALISCFIEQPGITIHRNTILEALGENPDHCDIRRLETLVRRFRLKAKASGIEELPLTTVYGKGYVFNGQISKF